MQGYNEEAANQVETAVRKLNAFNTCVEFLYFKDQLEPDEAYFVNKTEDVWNILTSLQKDILFMHSVQGITFSTIADLKGVTPQAVSQAFHRACNHFQTV